MLYTHLIYFRYILCFIGLKLLRRSLFALIAVMAFVIIWATSRENVHSNMRKIRKSRSSCACSKNHLGLCTPFIHSVIANDSVCGQWRPWSDCAMRSLIWAFASRICPKTHVFAWRGPNEVFNSLEELTTCNVYLFGKIRYFQNYLSV